MEPAGARPPPCGDKDERRELDDRAQGLLLAELLLVVFATAARRFHDPARLLAWIFGPLPELPWHDLYPWLSLLEGIRNVLLALAVVCLFSRHRLAEGVRYALTAFVAVGVCVVPTLAQVELRLNVDEAPGNRAPYVSSSHDGGVLQVEMAADALRRGESPYRMSYNRPPASRSPDSAIQGWRRLGYDRNPALDHLTYPPGVIYLSMLVEAVARPILGFYDPRLLYLPAAFALALVLASFVPSGPPRRMVVVATLANPLLARYVENGRNDVLVLLALASFAALLLRRRWRSAAVALGLAVSLKQFALFAVPFFVVALSLDAGRDLRQALARAWPVVAIPLVVAAPFLLTDPWALIENLFLWVQSGGYPVRWDGYGLTPLAYGLGLVDAPSGANPYGFLGLPVLIGSFAGLVVWVWRRPVAARVLLASGAWLFAMMLTARAFSPSYLSVPVLLWTCAWLCARSPLAGEGGRDRAAEP